MREDIIGAMKNAMDRGATAQQAARSLINSGYPAQEVNEALNFITGGTLNSLTPQPKQPFQSPSMMQKPVIPRQYPIMPQPMQQKPVMQPAMQQLPVMRPQQIYQPQQASKGGLKTLLLFIFLLILLGLLVGTIFFKDKILKFLS